MNQNTEVKEIMISESFGGNDINQCDNFVMIKTETEEVTQFSTNFTENHNISDHKVKDWFLGNSSQTEIYPNPFHLEVKPNIPLLFIEEGKKKTACNICHQLVLPQHNSVNCSSLCGKRQHLACITFNEGLREADGAGIVWKCNDCCILDALPKFNTAKGFEKSPLQEDTTEELRNIKGILEDPLNDDLILALKERQLHDNDGKTFPFTSPKHTINDDLYVSPPLMNSKFFLDNKHALDQSADISDISIYGTVAEEESSKKKKISSTEMAKNLTINDIADKENVNSNIEYVLINRGTRMGRPKLYDSLGFSYIIRTVTPCYTVWQCVRCNGWQKCQSYIKQTGKDFLRSKYKHYHPSVPAEFVAAKKLEVDLPSDAEIKLSKPKYIKPEKRLINLKRHPKRINVKPKLHITKTSKDKLMRRKSSYVEVQDESAKNNPPKLIDSLLGFSYKLHKTTERTKLWLCTMTGTNKNCEASVKQVGNYFIHSRHKHTHTSNRKEFAQNKKTLIKTKMKKAKHIRTMKLKSRSEVAVKSGYEGTKQIPSKEKKQTRLQVKVQSTYSGRSTPNKSHSSFRLSPLKHPSAMQGREIKSNIVQYRKFPSLIQEDEKKLVNNFLAMDASGLFLTNKVLIDNIQEYFNARNQCVFANNRPSRPWISNFMENHGELVDKYVCSSNYYDLQPLSANRLDTFFSNLEQLLKENYKLDIKSILSRKNARRVFNCDSIELLVNANACTKKIIPPEMRKNVREEGRRTMNVLCCISADGQSTKPLILNKGDHVFKYESQEGLDGTYDPLCSVDGEVTRKVFHTWLSEHFYKYLNDNKIQRPVLLLLNGTHCYVSIDSIEFAKSNGIVLYHIPPYTTRTLQPLSVSIFQILKKMYQKVFEESLNCNTKQLPKRLFPSVFMKAYNNIDIHGLSKCGFKATGICPLNTNEISKQNIVDNTDEDQANGNGDSNNLDCNVSSHDSSEISPSKTKNKHINSAKKNTKGKAKMGNKTNKLPDTDQCETKERSAPELNQIASNDKICLRNGYKLALDNVEKLFNAVVDPSVMNLYRQKFEAKAEYPDTTFLVWRGLQQLKEVPDLLSSLS